MIYIKSRDLEEKVDLTAVLALLVGLVMVILAHVFDGGNLSVLIQPTALLIVVGGSFCAALLNFNFPTIKTAFKNAKKSSIKKK